jgi:hypothetical protein
MVLRAPVKQAAPGVENEVAGRDVEVRPKSGETTSFMKTETGPEPVRVQPVAAEKTGKFDPQQAAMQPQTQMSPATQTPPAAAAAPQAAAVQILTGPNTGKELELVKNLTTLGKPGVQVAVLTRRPHGFFITHVEGAHHPVVNGQTLGDQPHQLSDHDVIELAGIKMEFYFKG